MRASCFCFVKKLDSPHSQLQENSTSQQEAGGELTEKEKNHMIFLLNKVLSIRLID